MMIRLPGINYPVSMTYLAYKFQYSRRDLVSSSMDEVSMLREIIRINCADNFSALRFVFIRISIKKK